MTKKLISLMILAGMLFLSACATTATPAVPSTPTQTRGSDQSGVGIANPSAVFCGEQGGQYEVTTAADGSQGGVCTLPDGTKCDGWAFFRGECGPKVESTDGPAGVPPAPNKPIDAAIQVMAKELSIQADTIEVLSSEQVNWPDACLGIAAPGEVCAQVVTAGYRVVLKAGDKTATYHTNVVGDVVRQETAGGAPTQ